VFKGPLVDGAGKELLAKDVVADDAWKGAINFYVKGVEGKVPSGK
jgi:basic membrane protein A